MLIKNIKKILFVKWQKEKNDWNRQNSSEQILKGEIYYDSKKNYRTKQLHTI